MRTTADKEQTPNQPLSYPVVLAYTGVWGFEDPNDQNFNAITLSQASLVSVGFTRDYYEYPLHWKTPLRRVLSHTGASLEEGDLEEGEGDAEDLANEWIRMAERSEGVSIDEFIPTGPSSWLKWKDALLLFRERFSQEEKMFVAWVFPSFVPSIGSPDPELDELLRVMEQKADYMAIEVYYNQTMEPNYQTVSNPFSLFRAYVEDAERRAPGILRKILIGLATKQRVAGGEFDDIPAENFGDYVVAQIRKCASDEVLSRTAGLALYHPPGATMDTLTKVNRAIQMYYGGDILFGSTAVDGSSQFYKLHRVQVQGSSSNSYWLGATNHGTNLPGYTLIGNLPGANGFWLCPKDRLSNHVFYVGKRIQNTCRIYKVAKNHLIEDLGEVPWNYAPRGAAFLGNPSDDTWVCMVQKGILEATSLMLSDSE